MKMMQFITNNVEVILFAFVLKNYALESLVERQIKYYCTYESRHDRINFYQKMLSLS